MRLATGHQEETSSCCRDAQHLRFRFTHFNLSMCHLVYSPNNETGIHEISSRLWRCPLLVVSLGQRGSSTSSAGVVSRSSFSAPMQH